MFEQIESAIKQIRKANPLVLNITNYVTMDFMANAQLAIGAAPIMTVCDEELEELVKIASSININLGTLDEAFIRCCHQALMFARQYSKPVVLDPVGAGCTNIRTRTAKAFMADADIVRGNASEIMSLASAAVGETHGVDSANSLDQAKDYAVELANQYGITIAISGPVDFVTDGMLTVEIPFGSALMPLVTGMGCTLTAVMAAFRGSLDNSFMSAKLAAAYFGLCGEFAENHAKFAGSFRTTFINALHAADFKQLHAIYVSKEMQHEI